MDNSLTHAMFLVINFLIVPVCFLLVCIMGHLILNKDKKKDTEFILEVPGGGNLTFKENKDNRWRCDSSECLFEKYNPTIIIEYKEKDNELYKEIFEYIYLNKENIESKLKELYDYQKQEIDKDFKISHISSSTPQKLISYIASLKDIGVEVLNIDNLEKIISNSNEDDIFIKISSEILGSEEYATAYINCRTKEICYCHDDEF